LPKLAKKLSGLLGQDTSGTIAYTIIPGNINVNKEENKIFIESFELGVKAGWWMKEPYLINQNIYPSLSDHLSILLVEYKERLENIVKEYAEVFFKEILNDIDSREEYRRLKSIYGIMALAQWYKGHVNTTYSLPYANLVDSENLSGIAMDKSFKKSYWDRRAYQLLESFDYNHFDGNYYSGSFYGGVTWTDIKPKRFNPLTSRNKTIIKKTIEEHETVQEGDSYYHLGAILKKPEVTLGIDTFFSSSSIEGLYVNRKAEFTLELSNSGNRDSGNVAVYLYLETLYGNANPILIESRNINIPPSSLSTQTFSWSTPNEPGEYIIKAVIESDNSTVKFENDTFIYQIDVLSNIPEVGILSPTAEGSTEIYLEEPIIFMGFAYDNEEGDITGDQLEWHSDVDGFLGTGSILENIEISSGKHTISLKATDKEGNLAQDTIQILKPPSFVVASEIFSLSTVSFKSKNTRVEAIALSDGDFIIFKGSYDGDSWGIFGQRYNKKCEKIGNQFLINSNIEGLQNNQAATSLKNNSFVVIWQSHDDIFAKIYNSNGETIKEEFKVNTNSVGGRFFLLPMSNEKFTVIWLNEKLYARTFSDRGELVQENNILISSDSIDIVAANGNDDSIFLLWHNTSSEDIFYSRIFNLVSGDIGEVYQLGQGSDIQIISLKNKKRVIVWTYDGNINVDIVTVDDQKIDNIGIDFVIEPEDEYNLVRPAITPFLNNNEFFISWRVEPSFENTFFDPRLDDKEIAMLISKLKRERSSLLLQRFSPYGTEIGEIHKFDLDSYESKTLSTLVNLDEKKLLFIWKGRLISTTKIYPPTMYAQFFEENNISAIERQVLVYLYNSTNGDDWINSDNWLTEKPVSEWYGVSTEDGFITKIELDNNNLVGNITRYIGSLSNLTHLSLDNNKLAERVPVEILKLKSLEVLSIQGNDYYYLPDLSSMESLLSLSVDRNLFTFEDIEPNIGIENIIYSPQSLVGEKKNSLVTEAKKKTFYITVGGRNNLYQWYKDDVAIPEATESSYSIDGLSIKDAGDYTCQITNSLVTGLTLYSRPMHLSVNKLPIIDFTVLVEKDEIGFDSYIIKWSDEDVDNDALISLYYDTDNEGRDGVLIAKNVSEDELSDQYVWEFADVPEGLYYIYAVINDMVGGLRVVYSQNRLLVAGVPATERDALIEFYKSTGGDNWTNNSNWLSNRPVSEWYGVTVEEGHVTELDLMNNNLSGTIPSAIGHLYELKKLELACYILRNPKPTSVLRDRFYLSSSPYYSKDLKRGNLEGSIPSEIGSLVNLTHLSVAGNDLEGEIPFEICSLTNLELFDISRNRLSGAMPDCIVNFSNLKALLVSYNNFDSLPNLSALPLTYLYLWSNKISFEDLEPNIDKLIRYTPQYLSKIGEEKTLTIDKGESYTFSVSVGGEHNLYQWYKNDVAIPGATEKSYTIDKLSLFDTGDYTCHITNCVVIGLTLYSRPIYLTVNKIPSIEFTTLVEGDELGVDFYTIKWTDDANNNALISLYYDTDNAGQDGTLITENILEDELSDEYVWNLTDIPGGEYYIYAVIDDGASSPRVVYSQNKILVAGVPASERDALIAFYENTNGDNWNNNSNWLSDRPINEWHGVTVENGHVTELSLLKNNLIGKFPEDLGKLSRLNTLDLRINGLTGSIPKELSNITSLKTLTLYSNKLTGSIPSELSKLSNLESLILNSNELSGTIPPELGNLSNLKFLEISANELITGSIPSELSNLNNLEELYLAHNKLIGSIPPELGNLSSLKILYLAINELTGTIPSEIGNLSSLEVLRLSNNKLEALIPSELGKLSNLTDLYLNNNKLEGQIPPELGNLSNLKVLSLGHNKLTGATSIDLSKLKNIIHIWIYYNSFTFEDLELNIGIKGIKYYNQSPIGEEQTLTIDEGDSYTFSVSVGGEHNLYQWYKNDVAIPGATKTTYTIDELLQTDSGDYICHITNSVVTDLTLYSRPIHLSVNKLLYGDANGDNVLNAADVSEVLNILSGSTIKNYKAADYNQDGRVDMKDVLQLMEYLSILGY